MEIEEREGFGKRSAAPAGPSAAVAELTAAAEPEPEPDNPEPSAQSRWIRPLSCYERRETTIVEGLRYG